MDAETLELNRKLWKYYKGEVEINEHKFNRAKRVIETLIQDFDNFRRARKDNGVFVRLEKAGSAFEGLKVRAPDEFDLMVVLEIPDDGTEQTLVTRSVDQLPFPHRGLTDVSSKYKALQLLNLPRLESACASLHVQPQSSRMRHTKWVDESNFVYHTHLLDQFHGVIDQFKNYVDGLEGDYSLDTSQIRPGMKLGVNDHQTDDPAIDVDILPVFEALEMDQQDRRKGIFIARPPRPLKDQPVEHYIWRQCFTLPERELFTRSTADLGPSFLATVRIIKSLRCEDANKHLTSAPSYVVKTLAMHFAQRNWGWGEKHLAARVKDFLYSLKENVHEGFLPSYWKPDHNVLGDMTTTQRAAVEDFLRDRVDKVASLLPPEYR